MVPYDFCVDFRALNSESVSDDFPMEDAVELIHSIGRANIITTLDLLKGYWAIPMAEDKKNLTSFKTHRQQYRFKVMSFENFHVPTSTTLQSSPKNWEEHLLHLDTILTKLSELNFTVNLKKCAFGKAQIKYLGHIIGSGKHEPDPEKTAVINNLPVPKTKKELRSVLGLCNYYLEAPSLYSPVPDKPYTIHSDASQIGIAACLSQKCGDKCYPIAYASQKLTQFYEKPIESRFCTVEEAEARCPQGIRLFNTNNSVNEYNNKILNVYVDRITSTAKDVYIGCTSKEQETFVHQKLLKMSSIDTNGFPYQTVYVKNIYYMITTNIDVADGLANGAVGKLVHVETNYEGLVKTIWLEFPDLPQIGEKLRRKAAGYAAEINVSRMAAPIVLRSSLQYSTEQ
ncbi:hypothetical protein TNCV_2598981 [Trichonephila clavipes]|nr:hypothetical protein TNCV_2598981 [Trichonephila clavipes]